LIHNEHEREQGPTPLYDISPELSDLTKKFIIAAVIYFIIAGVLALIMRTIQSKVMLLGDQNQTFGFFYSSLTVHGQLMFFGFASMMVVGISYYLVSKFAKKNLFSFNLAILSFSLLNAGAVLLIISGTMFFGAGWYNLMPLTFHPGNNGWTIFSSVIFLIADLIIGIALTIFSINVIATLLIGRVAAGVQRSEVNYDVNESSEKLDAQHKSKSDEEDKGRADLLLIQYIPAAVRWCSLLGISSWLPRKSRSKIPAVSIVVVGIFVNALIQLMGNVGLFAQLAIGFSYLVDPNFKANWLLAKDVWWFFGHPIVYFTLFSFLGAAYYYIPRYAKKTVAYDKWAYRSWPFYFVFTMLVFSHHLFMDMPNPDWLEMVAQTASFGIVFPSGLTIMTVLMYIFRSRIKWNITALFMMAGIAGWAFGGFAGVETGWRGTDLYLHNTLNVVGHIHFVLLMGSVLFGIGLIYSIVPAITKKNFEVNLGIVHLVSTLIGGFGLAFMFLFLGFAGFVRREADIPQIFAWALPWLLFLALVVGFGQIVFIYNLFKTLLRKKRSNQEKEYFDNQQIRILKEKENISV
jgi:cytochrome c oxidase subunit 1